MRYLLLVEGARTEINIFQKVLERYGLTVLTERRIESFAEPDFLTIPSVMLEDKRNSVLIVQPPRNRLKDLLEYYQREDIDLNLVSGSREKLFNAIFLIFDVDHTPQSALEEMYAFHKDETDTELLLISSPCIEILSEPGRTGELRVKHLKEYKTERNNYFSDRLRLGINTEEYISRNFEEPAVYYLDQNYRDFNDSNVMNHPEKVIRKVNEINIRSDDEVLYRYFTTVVYVLIACIFGFNSDFDNYLRLREFLLSQKGTLTSPLLN